MNRGGYEQRVLLLFLFLFSLFGVDFVLLCSHQNRESSIQYTQFSLTLSSHIKKHRFI